MPRVSHQGSSDLGKHLKLLRVKNSLTMTQTADLTGITQGYISQIENGIYTPSAKTLAKLARAYEVPELQLLRKAGIVQFSSSVPSLGDLDKKFTSNLIYEDPLIEVSDSRELMELLRRGLSSLESLSTQIRQKSQVATLPSALEMFEGKVDLAAAGELNLSLYQANWEPVFNALREPAGLRLPSHLCAEDPDAFILVTEDDSMAPLIGAGDWVVISPGSELESGQVVAINDRNQIQLRSYMAAGEILSLIPLNAEFAEKGLLVDKQKDKVEIVGRALRVVNRDL